MILDERFGPIGNDRYKTYLADIHQSGTHVLNLLSDLLDLSKTQAGRMPMHPAAIDVNRVIGECVTTLQTIAHRERVIVRLSLLPQLAEALVDERAFRQIMGSILSNAIAFNEPGGQVIVSTAMTEGDAVAVRVRDTGIGMSDADIAMALEPFRQIKTTKAGSGVGSGLGLPLARALVEANGATMSIKSQKDEGTLVEIVLPASPRRAAARAGGVGGARHGPGRRGIGNSSLASTSVASIACSCKLVPGGAGVAPRRGDPRRGRSA